jgi:hypothetical protein
LQIRLYFVAYSPGSGMPLDPFGRRGQEECGAVADSIVFCFTLFDG